MLNYLKKYHYSCVRAIGAGFKIVTETDFDKCEEVDEPSCGRR
jgi:hypothetical protein